MNSEIGLGGFGVPVGVYHFFSGCSDGPMIISTSFGLAILFWYLCFCGGVCVLVILTNFLLLGALDCDEPASGICTIENITLPDLHFPDRY